MALPKSQNDLPKGTPVFARCKLCRGVLPYPPIQIARRPEPSQEEDKQIANKARYVITWDNYCIDCAFRKLRQLRKRKAKNALVPHKCWDIKEDEVVDNPYVGGKDA